jgi:micrococcal nuclease
MIIVPENLIPDEAEDLILTKVTKVFDGDGFLGDTWVPHQKLAGNKIPFRFAFIDAPEIEQQSGPEARDFLTSLINGKALKLIPIFKESMGNIPLDPYKRLLCTGYHFGHLPNGKVEYFYDGKRGRGLNRKARTVTRNIELEMVINGWAWVAEIYSFEQKDTYLDAQSDARRHQRGLWAFNKPEPPWIFKSRQRRQKQSSSRQSSLL